MGYDMNLMIYCILCVCMVYVSYMFMINYVCISYECNMYILRWISECQTIRCVFAKVPICVNDTVDGRKPKQPPGMYKTLYIHNGINYQPQLGQDLFYQQYYSHKNLLKYGNDIWEAYGKGGHTIGGSLQKSLLSWKWIRAIPRKDLQNDVMTRHGLV